MTSIVEQPGQVSPNGEATVPSRAYDPGVPAFLVGVTGYMSLDDEQAKSIESRLRLVFRFLRQGGEARDPDGDMGDETFAESLAELMVPEPPGAEIPGLWDAYENMLRAWPGLGDVPIAVMCNLAPGVDTIAARVALSPEFRSAGFHVRAPLPFPADLYRDASTFIRNPSAPAAEDLQRRRDFDELLKTVGVENAFPVCLQRDLGTPPTERRERLLDERDDESDAERRRRRYYAAGEYLAVTSHLLIAVWDGEPGEAPGTASVVEARLRGPRSDVLTTSEGIRQPAGGPALHLYAKRAGGSDVNSGSVPDARLLHPFSAAGEDEPGDRLLGEGQGGWIEPVGEPARREGIERRNRHALQSQRDRFAILCRVAANLREFGEAPPHPTPEDCDRDYRALLKYGAHDYFPTIRAMRMADEPQISADAEGAFSRSQRTLSNLRFKATKASRILKEKHDRSMKILFWITLAAAASLHLFSHWHLKPPKPTDHPGDSPTAAAHAHEEEHPTQQPTDDTHGDDHAFSAVQFMAGCLAAALAATALLFFFYCRMRRYAERHHDYRALAEGVRVQFYWNLAGLGRSVSANYMHRQRSELDWIRAAIRSVTFPYEPWRERFRRLPRADQVEALRCVLRCWIDVQRDYFQKSWHANHHKLHAWHKVGAVLAIGGVVLLGFCVAQKWYPQAFGIDGRTMVVLPISAALIWLGVMAFRYLTGDLRPAGEHPNHDKPWVRCVHWLAPAPEDHATSYRTPGERAFRSVLGFFARLPLALILVYIVYELLGMGEHPDVPVAAERILIFGGIALLAGALAVAWAEKNLLSELAYQYNTMHSLFRDASSRLDYDLNELERLAAGPAETYEAKLDEVQEYLYALGKEALDENAEWLLLHRARPLEPVMAG